MHTRKRPVGSFHAGSPVCWPSLFLRQPPRVLIVEALPPWWSETGTVLCEALDNFLSLACSLDGPCRIPLLSLYAISRQQECLLPFVQVCGNLARLRSCVEELRSISGEGCIRGPTRRGELLRQAVLDSLQQFKQYTRHTSAGSQASNNTSVEVTVVTSQPGRGIIRQLEAGLKDADLVSLRRLLVVQISNAADSGHDAPSPEDTHSEADECLMLGAEVDLQQVDNSVVAMETVFKAWLHGQGGDGEHLHLLLPNNSENRSPVCVKCDVQERLLSPALFSLTPSLGVKTESIQDFLPPAKASANHSAPPQRLKPIRALRADGVCESVLYGLPLVIRPTTCWQLDWDELETNHNLFHALCHTLRSRDLFLLVRLEPAQSSAAGGSGVYSYYVLQPSPSLSLLLKPVVCRELLLPCSLPVSNQDPPPDALHTVQSCLVQLDEDSVFNPLALSSRLHQHLKSRGLLSQPRYPYRLQQTAHREPAQPLEAPKTTNSRQPRQSQHLGRPLGTAGKVRATVAPLSSSSSSSSSLGPPPCKSSRPALTFLSSRAPAPTAPLRSSALQEGNEEDDEDDEPMMIL